LNGKFISVDGYERVPVFALCPEEKAIPERGFKKRSLNLAEA